MDYDFMLDQLAFPTGFLWGSATSAYQVEGNSPYNQWSEFEQLPGVIWHGDRSGLACDWWRNAEQDFARMTQLHMNVHRLGVEWSRIEPVAGEIDHAALERYRVMLGGLRARGIRPMVALHHFTNPRWFERAGGWTQPESVVRFQKHVRTVVQALGDLCDFWLTMNEPMVYVVQSFVRGIWPPQQRNFAAAHSVLAHLLLAHAAAYQAVHSLQPGAQVSYTHALHDFRAERPQNPLDRYVAQLRAYLIDHLWVKATLDGKLHPPLGFGQYQPALANSFDFVAINYYTSLQVRFTPNPLVLFGRDRLAANAELSDSGQHGPYSAYQPRGLYRHCLEQSALGKPIYITENGLPDADDDQRPRWLLGHLYQLHRAIRAGCDVRGYFHWTLVDNFEWCEGWGLRFGLFDLEPQTQVRTARPSAHLFAAIARENAVTRATVAQYAPEIVEEYFAEEERERD
jgi:beta-glucosidase